MVSQPIQVDDEVAFIFLNLKSTADCMSSVSGFGYQVAYAEYHRVILELLRNPQLPREYSTPLIQAYAGPRYPSEKANALLAELKKYEF